MPARGTRNRAVPFISEGCCFSRLKFYRADRWSSHVAFWTVIWSIRHGKVVTPGVDLFSGRRVLAGVFVGQDSGRVLTRTVGGDFAGVDPLASSQIDHHGSSLTYASTSSGYSGLYLWLPLHGPPITAAMLGHYVMTSSLALAGSGSASPVIESEQAI
jgi:hypothetical protein